MINPSNLILLDLRKGFLWKSSLFFWSWIYQPTQWTMATLNGSAEFYRAIACQNFQQQLCWYDMPYTYLFCKKVHISFWKIFYSPFSPIWNAYPITPLAVQLSERKCKQDIGAITAQRTFNLSRPLHRPGFIPFFLYLFRCFAVSSLWRLAHIIGAEEYFQLAILDLLQSDIYLIVLTACVCVCVCVRIRVSNCESKDYRC